MTKHKNNKKHRENNGVANSSNLSSKSGFFCSKKSVAPQINDNTVTGTAPQKSWFEIDFPDLLKNALSMIRPNKGKMLSSAIIGSMLHTSTADNYNFYQGAAPGCEDFCANVLHCAQGFVTDGTNELRAMWSSTLSGDADIDIFKCFTKNTDSIKDAILAGFSSVTGNQIANSCPTAVCDLSSKNYEWSNYAINTVTQSQDNFNCEAFIVKCENLLNDCQEAAQDATIVACICILVWTVILTIACFYGANYRHSPQEERAPLLRNVVVTPLPPAQTTPLPTVHRPNSFHEIADLVEQCNKMGIDYLSKLPQDCICPISLDVMLDPTIANDSQTYDRNSLNQLLEKSYGKPRSPITRQLLKPGEFRVNLFARNAIIAAMQKIINEAKCAQPPQPSI